MKTLTFLSLIAVGLLLIITKPVYAGYSPTYYSSYYDVTPYYYESSYYSSYPTYSYVQPVSLSQTSLTLSPGQNASVQIYGAGAHSVSIDNPTVATLSFAGDILTIRALSAGWATIAVCDGVSYYGYNSGCSTLTLSVQGSNYYPSYYPGYPYSPNYPASYTCDPYYCSNYYIYDEGDLLDETSVRIDKGERERIGINRRYGRVYISDNSNDRIADADIDDNDLVIKGLREGTTRITVCDNHTCSTVRVTVRD